MRLKPKSTVHNPRALLYKRFTDLELSVAKRVLYITADGKKWIFDNTRCEFLPYLGEASGFENDPIYAYDPLNPSALRSFSYKNLSFIYENGEWKRINGSFVPQVDAPVVSTKITEEETHYEYDIPDSCVVDFPQSLEVTLSHDHRLFINIQIYNSAKQCAIYQGIREIGDPMIYTVNLLRITNSTIANKVIANYTIMS